MENVSIFDILESSNCTMSLQDRGYGELAIAIIEQAVEDYEHALYFIKQFEDGEINDNDSNIKAFYRAIKKAEDCENFFQSKWFSSLYDRIPGQTIIDVIQERINKNDISGMNISGRTFPNSRKGKNIHNKILNGDFV